jgi:flagellar biosynthesis chaperone FliJ
MRSVNRNTVAAQLELERVQLQHKLREVAVQNRAVGAVVERWRTEDRQSDNRREQRDIDERAQRPLRVAAADA